MITNWDDAYANGAYIAEADLIVAGWAERSARVREMRLAETLKTGPNVRNRVDLYRPKGAIHGLTVIVHGGYWMAFSGADFAHLVEGPLARGQAVACVTYTLAPEARISEITQEVARAVAVSAAEVAGPIRLIGHSAGGHLVTRMVCDGVLQGDLAGRMARVVSVSGLHDLRPLLRTRMNETLRLTEDEAVSESPALQRPVAGVPVVCVVGAEERPEFRRQTALLANIWTGLGADISSVELEGVHHFSIIAGLEAPDGSLTSFLLD